jgi:hypothetical protein
MDKNVRFL